MIFRSEFRSCVDRPFAVRLSTAVHQGVVKQHAPETADEAEQQFCRIWSLAVSERTKTTPDALHLAIFSPNLLITCRKFGT
jgi:DNA-binding PucR family transcriptional regulator